jgi:hypothetical protein
MIMDENSFDNQINSMNRRQHSILLVVQLFEGNFEQII